MSRSPRQIVICALPFVCIVSLVACTISSVSSYPPKRVYFHTFVTSLLHWIIIYSFRVFSHQRRLMVFHWSLSDSKSPQVSRTLLRILAVLNNAVVWMVSTRPPTSKSSSPFSNPLVTVPKTPITISIIVTCMFHSFFSRKVEVLILVFTFFQFYSVVSQDSKVDNFASSLFFLFFYYYY